ncbi:MAG: LysR family transcriptional regulator [Bacteroidales bacterium]|nr:LysR family transcriptional regulator [Bacteroidales bacterium]
MTLQQLEYIIAVNTYRHFSKAAEACGVTQPTLSAQVQKLEEELGVPIFDRRTVPLTVTMAGELIVKQAAEAVRATQRMVETAHSVKNQASGEVRIGMVTSVAPYLMPPLVQYMRQSCPEVRIHCFEGSKSILVGKIQRGELDMLVMANATQVPNLLAIPLYTENILAYLPANSPLLAQEELSVETLRREQVWAYRDMQESVFGTELRDMSAEFETGSLFTLLALAEANGGVMLAPQTIIDILLSERIDYLRPITDPAPTRVVQLYVREDYVMEQLLNVVGEAVCNIVPEPMLDDHLQKFGIKL